MAIINNLTIFICLGLASINAANSELPRATVLQLRAQRANAKANIPWLYGVVVGLGKDTARYQVLQQILDPSAVDQLILITNRAGPQYNMSVACETMSNSGKRSSFSLETQDDDVIVISARQTDSQGITCDLWWISEFSCVPLYMKGITNQIIELAQYGAIKPRMFFGSYNDTA